MPKAMYKQLRLGVAQMLESIPAVLFDSAAAKQMGMSVAQSCCHWTGERGQAPKERMFSPVCSFENKIFFKVHRHSTSISQCVFWCSQWEKKSLVSSEDDHISCMAVVWLTYKPSCLKMPFHLPQHLAFSSTHRVT